MTADPSRRLHLYAKQSGRCFYCKRGMRKYDDGPLLCTVDEVRARARGGRRILGNQVAACKFCNNLKADKTLRQFQRIMDEPWFQALIAATDDERRAERLKRKLRRKALPGLDKRKDVLPSPPADLANVFKSAIGDRFPITDKELVATVSPPDHPVP